MHGNRANLRYYQIVRRWLDEHSRPRGLHSILDVGCRDTWTATFGDFAMRYALDLSRTPDVPGVRGFTGDWMKFDLVENEIRPPISCVTCLQVLEHLEEPRPFVEKLMESASLVIISVPLHWPRGECDGHRQDPVSLPKIASWFGGQDPYKFTATVDGMHRLGLRFVGIWKGAAG